MLVVVEWVVVVERDGEVIEGGDGGGGERWRQRRMAQLIVVCKNNAFELHWQNPLNYSPPQLIPTKPT